MGGLLRGVHRPPNRSRHLQQRGLSYALKVEDTEACIQEGYQVIQHGPGAAGACGGFVRS